MVDVSKKFLLAVPSSLLSESVAFRWIDLYGLKGNTVFFFLYHLLQGFHHWNSWSGKKHICTYLSLLSTYLTLSKCVLFNVEYSEKVKRKCFDANDYQLKNSYCNSLFWEILLHFLSSMSGTETKHYSVQILHRFSLDAIQLERR